MLSICKYKVAVYQAFLSIAARIRVKLILSVLLKNQLHLSHCKHIFLTASYSFYSIGGDSRRGRQC